MMYCWKLRNRKLGQSAAENKAAFAYYKKEVLPCQLPRNNCDKTNTAKKNFSSLWQIWNSRIEVAEQNCSFGCCS